MLSRVADSIYWMSRYVERAENVARFIAVNLNLSLDMPGDADQQWLPLVVTTGDDERVRQALHDDDQAKRRPVSDVRPRESQFDHVVPAGGARERPRRARNHLVRDVGAHQQVLPADPRERRASRRCSRNPYEFFDQIRVSGQQFMGVTDATMTHGEGWHFCQLGRMLERADKTSRILDVKYFILLPSPADVGTPFDDIQWSALLRSASALEMYRQRHGRIQPASVVQFLVLDREFPRAVLHCLTKANESLHAISGTAMGGFSNRAERSLGQLRAELAYTSAPQIIQRGLHEFVDDLQQRLNDVGEAIHEAFFAMRPLETMSQSQSQYQFQQLS